MAVRIDPLREEVCADDRAWPFALDCRDDVATIELGGLTYRLRPLRWREKRNLARYAGLGDEFVERQLVRACLDGATPLPADRREREVLAGLARWISAPADAGAALPLDPVLLARVGLAVARQSGVGPTAIEAESADVVESLWRRQPEARAVERPEPAVDLAPAEPALAPPPPRAAEGALPDPGDMVRILIVPDPPAEPAQPDGAALASDAGQADGAEQPDLFGQPLAAGRPLDAPRVAPALPDAVSAPLADAASAPLDGAAAAPVAALAPARSRFRFRVLDADAGPAPAAPTPASPARPDEQPRLATSALSEPAFPPEPRFPPEPPAPDRPIAAGPRPNRRPAERGFASDLGADAPLASPLPLGEGQGEGVPMGGAGWRATDRARALGGAALAPADGPPPAAPSLDRLSPLGAGPAAHRLVWPAPSASSAHPAALALDPLPPPRPADDRLEAPPLADDLFEEWAERLEEAAEQMGVDLEA